MSFDMYQENILDHYENPYHRGTLDDPTVEHRDLNPLCGDEVRILPDPQGERHVALLLCLLEQPQPPIQPGSQLVRLGQGRRGRCRSGGRPR